MTTSTLIHHWRSCNDAASHAYLIGDERDMDRYLDARNALGTILRERDHAAWRAIHATRFSPSQPASA